MALTLSLVAYQTTAIAGPKWLILVWLGSASFLWNQDNGISPAMALAFTDTLVDDLPGYTLSGARSQKQIA